MPKKQKYRKQHKLPFKGKARSGTTLAFGEYGIKAMTGGHLTARQIEAARRAIARHVRRGAKVWIRVFPHKPVTKHGEGQRMGKGKGSVSHFSAEVKAGKMIMEMKGVSEEISRGALERAAAKFPVKIKIVSASNSL